MRWTAGVVIGVAVLALATGCGTAADGGGTTTPGPNPQAAGESAPVAGTGTPVPNGPNVQEALDTANQEFKLLVAGDWAGAWALWTDGAKKEVPRKDFEKVNKTCPAQKGVEFQLQDVKPVSMELVELTWRRGETVGHSAIRLTDKKWFYDPGSEMLVEYASGADAAIAKRRSSGGC
jgi:hypothetical protein